MSSASGPPAALDQGPPKQNNNGESLFLYWKLPLVLHELPCGFVNKKLTSKTK